MDISLILKLLIVCLISIKLNIYLDKIKKDKWIEITTIFSVLLIATIVLTELFYVVKAMF